MEASYKSLEKSLGGSPKYISPSSQVDNHVMTAIENKIRAHAYHLKLRMTDLFEDYDKLRSGFMTATQFRRCVNSAYNRCIAAPFSDKEFELIVKHYTVNGDGLVKWTAFVESIDKVFAPKILTARPSLTALDVAQSTTHIDESDQSAFNDLIEKIKSYVKHHGSDVKSWFRDFDKYHNGIVTYNQFKRGIPPNLLSGRDEERLMRQYGEKTRGTINYFKFNTDVTRKSIPRSANIKTKHFADVPPSEDSDIPLGTEYLLISSSNYEPGQLNISAIQEKIKKQVYKERIRVNEFFRDWDHHNCGLVSEFQFRSVLPLLNLRLDQKEINIIVRFYQIKDGRIKYRDFCNAINSVFTIDHLEKMPTLQVSLPPKEFLVQGTNPLSFEDELKCQDIIARLSKLMSEKRLIMAPFFKDFDKNLGNLGRVTRSHFARLMSTFRIPLTDDEMHVIFKKFADKNQGKVNYMEFIRAIDAETYSSTSPSRLNSADSTSVSESLSSPTWESVLSNIRHFVSTRRVRVAEFFKNFDKLRTYSISEREFCRGVFTIGYPITPQEYKALASHYQDENKQGCCKWRQFQQDIEAGQHDPLHNTALAYKAGLSLTPEESELLNKTMHSIQGFLASRQTSVKSFFKDFDKLCTGHVSKSQFRQCLTYLQCNLTEKEFEVICKNWVKLDVAQPHRDYVKDKSDRICYISFLEELEKGIQAISHSLHSSLSDSTKSWSQSGSRRSLSDVEARNLLLHIKTKCKRERIRVIDFMQDFDHLRHGMITKNEFYRALKVIFIDLTEAELNALERLFINEKDPRYVNYVAFSDTIESAFTKKGLEKNPLALPEVFSIIADGVNINAVITLDSQEESIYFKSMDRMAEKIKQKRIEYLPYFEDFDFVREGTITKNQFRSVLNTVCLDVGEYEIDILSRKFATPTDRVYYRTFATLLQGFIDAKH